MAIDVGVALSERGFFPEVLPPCFTSQGLADFLTSNRAAVNAKRLEDRAPAKLIRLNSPKNNGARRTFSTAHPLNYLFIAEFLNQHWGIIQSHYQSKTKISASVPSIEAAPSPRSVRITSFPELSLLVHKNIQHSSHLLRTDIAQFYPSLYTHSIPWAMHTKKKSKNDRSKKSANCFFNELDYHLRNCQDGQTQGLFVGPDAARIISELVTSDIDKFLIDRVAKNIVGAVRFVDDYFIGIESENDAQIVLTALREALNEYELNLNDGKTKITETSGPMDDLWPLQLVRITNQFFQNSPIPEHHLAEAVDCALEAANKFESQSPIKLLLRQFDKYDFESRAEFSFIENYLLRFIHHFPYAIDYVCMIVGARALRGGSLNQNAWTHVIHTEITRYAGLRYHQEIAWLLWLGIVAQLKFENSLIDMILAIENAHLSAMVAAAISKGVLKNNSKISAPSPHDMISDSWLFAHEAILGGFEKASLQNDEMDLHKYLLGKGFSFVDFSLVTAALKSSGPVISSIRFGYEDEDVVDPFIEKVDQIFSASSDDF